MKIALISDTHFGDSNSILVTKSSGDNWELNPEYYNKFKKTLFLNSDGSSDYKYLIILGDVFDLAVSNYKNTYNAARPFFSQLAKDKLFEEIIVVTGNHDHTLWTNLQYMENVVKKINNPTAMEWSIPGVIDNRDNKLQLTGNYYTKTFLDDLSVPGVKFNIVSPNIYLLDKEKTILFTHGQYFQAPWAVFGNIASTMFGSDLNKIELSKMQHILGDNFAMNQILCSCLGQSEENFTNIIQNLEHTVSNGDYSLLISYIANILIAEGWKKDLLIALLAVIGYFLLSKIFASSNKSVSSEFKDNLLSYMKENEEKNPNFKVQEDEVKDVISKLSAHMKEMDAKQASFIQNFYKASLDELKKQVKKTDPIQPIDIDNIIFGHTHKPVDWTSDKINWNNFNWDTAPNTGAWLFKGKNKTLCGAIVFTYDADSLEVTSKALENE